MEEKSKGLPAAVRLAAALLPLAAMGVGVWYYLYGRVRPEPPAVESFSPRTPAGKADAQAEAGRIPSRLRTAAPPSMSLDINGSPEFKAQVTDALKLIWDADRDTFLFVKANLFVIRNGDKTDFYLEDGRPAASISNDHAFRSKTWCAGIIAHQAWHAWYAENRKKKARREPPLPGEPEKLRLDLDLNRMEYRGMDALLDMENRASLYQLDVLRKVGAPRRETDPVFRRAPRDFETAHDGGFELKP